jgi:hypothetical protein
MFFLRITIPAVLLALTACGAGRGAPPPSQSRSEAEPQPPPNLPITMDAARATALARVPGQVTEEEIELEDGRWVYEFDIRPNQPAAAMAPPSAAPAAPAAVAPAQEVTVDATTGQVLEVEAEDDSHDGQDNDDDDDD